MGGHAVLLAPNYMVDYFISADPGFSGLFSQVRKPLGSVPWVSHRSATYEP